MRSVVTWLVLGGWCAAVPAAVLAQTNSIVLEQILVKVNGEIITKTQLEERQVQFLRNQGMQGRLDENTSDADLERLLSEATPQMIVDAIDEMLLVQHGKERASGSTRTGSAASSRTSRSRTTSKPMRNSTRSWPSRG